jgi:hypothetical protein
MCISQIYCFIPGYGLAATFSWQQFKRVVGERRFLDARRRIRIKNMKSLLGNFLEVVHSPTADLLACAMHTQCMLNFYEIRSVVKKFARSNRVRQVVLRNNIYIYNNIYSQCI